VISTRSRTPGPRLSSARSRLRACLAAARMSTLLASSSLQSPPLAPAGLPAASRGVGVCHTVTRLAPALRPSADTPAARPLPVTGATFGLEATSLEVPFRPRGFSPPRRFSPRDGSQVCCTLQPALGFATFRIVKSVSQFRERSRSATTPRRTPPPQSRDAVTRARCLPDVLPPSSTERTLAGTTGRKLEAVAFEALICEVVLDRAACCHSAPSCSFLGFSPLRGFDAAVSRPPALSPGRETRNARRR